MAEQVTPLDAIFLELEEADAGSHMHIGAALLFDPPPRGGVPTLDELREMVEQRRTGEISRFEQVLSQPHTGGMTWPAWKPGPGDEALREHVRQATLPEPGGEAELIEWLGDFWSHRLDRSRPLWEFVLLDGLEGGGWALVNKTHHALIDGVGSVDIGGTLLDASPDAAADRPAAAASEPQADAEPADHPDHGDPALVRMLKLPPSLLLRGARTGLTLATHPGRALEIADRSRAAVEVLIRDELLAAPRTSLNVPLSGTRRFAAVRFELDEAKAIKNALGGTVNDVVLAACAGALRELLIARGETPPHGFRAMVPVNVRHAGEQLEMGNRITSLFVELPVDVADTAERHAGVVRASAVMDAVALAPPVLHAFAARALFSPRLFNVTITNVPGPRTPLYALGSRLREILPLVPLFSDHTLGIAIVSYEGRLVFGINADANAVRDLDVFVAALEHSLAELQELAA
jgi:WS/DGAT/MGAT family acyltransferase